VPVPGAVVSETKRLGVEQRMGRLARPYLAVFNGNISFDRNGVGQHTSYLCGPGKPFRLTNRASPSALTHHAVPTHIYTPLRPHHHATNIPKNRR